MFCTDFYPMQWRHLYESQNTSQWWYEKNEPTAENDWSSQKMFLPSSVMVVLDLVGFFQGQLLIHEHCSHMLRYYNWHFITVISTAVILWFWLAHLFLFITTVWHDCYLVVSISWFTQSWLCFTSEFVSWSEKLITCREFVQHWSHSGSVDVDSLASHYYDKVLR